MENEVEDKEYLPITGLPEFIKPAAATLLAYDSRCIPLNEGRVRFS